MLLGPARSHLQRVSSVDPTYRTLLPKGDGGKLKFKPPPPLDSSPLFSGLRVLDFLPLG